MKFFTTLFLMISFYSFAFAQQQEENTKPKIHLMCDPSIDDMMLYIIDGVYIVTEDQKRVATNIDNSYILFIGMLYEDTDEFKKEASQTPYPEKIRKVITINLTDGAPFPYEIEE